MSNTAPHRFLPGNKHGVPVPRVSLVWLSQVLSNTPKEIGRFRKNQASKQKLTRVMQYARALERTKAILEAGFELVECWEHDFHESTIYLKKNTETFPHAMVYDFVAWLDKSN